MFTLNRPSLLGPHKHSFDLKEIYRKYTFQEFSIRGGLFCQFYFQIPHTKIAILPVEAVHPFILSSGVDIGDIHHLLLSANQAAF